MREFIEKLQMKGRLSGRFLDIPQQLQEALVKWPVELLAGPGKKVGFVLEFVHTSADIVKRAPEAASLPKEDDLLWFACSTQSSGINRDHGWEPPSRLAFRPVRQVPIDSVWSALRLRERAKVPKYGRERMRRTVVLMMLWSAGLLLARDKPAIAVLDLSGNGLERGLLDGLTNRLRAEFFDTERFTVVERGEMEAILREQGFQQTGCTDSSCAVEVGQLLNVRFMIVGSVDRLGSVYSVNIRQVSIETGQVVSHVKNDCCDCSIEDVVLRGIRSAARRMAGLEEMLVELVDESARTWELLGMTEEEYTAFRGSGLSQENWREYTGTRLALREYVVFKQTGLSLKEYHDYRESGLTLEGYKERTWHVVARSSCLIMPFIDHYGHGYDNGDYEENRWVPDTEDWRDRNLLNTRWELGLALNRHYFDATLHYFEHHAILVREAPPDTTRVHFYFQDPGLRGGGLTYLFTVWSLRDFLNVQSGLWAGYTQKTIEWWTARSNGIDDTWDLREARKEDPEYYTIGYTNLSQPVKDRNFAALLAVLGLGYRFAFVDLEYNLYVGNQPLTHAFAVGLRLKI